MKIQTQAVLISIGVASITSLAWYIGQTLRPIGQAIAIGILTLTLLMVAFEVGGRIKELARDKMEGLIETKFYDMRMGAVWDYRQVQALFALYHQIDYRAPLSPMRLWAISPDFIAALLPLLDTHKPRFVLELGSGLSTVNVGYYLEQAGTGRILSVDHEAQFADATRRMLETHQLTGVATVVHAPLTRYDIEPEPKLWYDLVQVPINEPIDLLIIDGPPGGVQPNSRYPAWPLLKDKLADNALIVMDDANRDDEKAIIEMWQALEPRLTVETILTEKGMAVLCIFNNGAS